MIKEVKTGLTELMHWQAVKTELKQVKTELRGDAGRLRVELRG